MEVKNYYKVELPEFEFNPSANSLQYNVWIENINPKLLDSETRIKDITVKNENLLLEQQNLKKGLAMQNAELHLSLQVFETKLEQQQKLQDARRQEMENESSSLLLRYEDLNNKVVKLRQRNSQEQQKLREEIWTLEKQ
ncbi:uncharacterized protein LOC111613147 [Centruroides sculpturatus]|uniref:uncharacterized protein LOC111613147 n=1 Tax=Centruroides sculpturatus TaxID=218467 RepID=UPI000C6DD11E|nr:uncharacterized protein LOC111613147 [Centruroides sculpturatus]